MNKKLKKYESIVGNKGKVAKKNLKEKSSNVSYEASVLVRIEEDSYEEGLLSGFSNNYDYIVKSKTFSGLVKELQIESGVDSVRDIAYGNINEYDWGSELWIDVLCNDNGVPASRSEIEQWKNGDLSLYLHQHHVIVSKIGKFPVSEDEIRSAGITREI